MMELPRKVVVGNDVLRMAGDVCRSMGFSGKTLVITGPNTYSVAGRIVLESLSNSSFSAAEMIVDTSFDKAVEAAEARVLKENPDLILGVGGGRIIDLAKYVSAKNIVQFISIPTSASHDGIASPQASINLNSQVSVRAQAPIAIIADIGVIAKSSFRLTASGCGDVLAKFTAVRDWLLAHNIKNEYYGDYAANLSLMSAKLVARNSSLIYERSIEGVRVVVEALVSCGVAMSIAGSSRPCSGSEHLFSHALDAVAPNRALHGEQCGVGTVMMAYLHRMNWEKIRSVLKKIGAPIDAEGLNVTPENIVEALTNAHRVRPERYTILGENGLSEKAALKLAKNTGVIS